MRFLLAFAQGGLVSPLLPLLRETFRVSPGELGLLTSMSGLSSVVMDIIAAYLLQRRPLLSLLLQGIGLAGVALLGSMLAPGFYWLVAAQMLLGFGLGITRVACLMVIVTGTPRAVQGRANNLLEFSAIAGLTLSPTLSGLTASLLHWRAAFGQAGTTPLRLPRHGPRSAQRLQQLQQSTRESYGLLMWPRLCCLSSGRRCLRSNTGWGERIANRHADGAILLGVNTNPLHQ